MPSIRPAMVLNCWRTSSTMASAALPTDFMVMLLNQYGSIAPMSRPANTCTEGASQVHECIKFALSSFEAPNDVQRSCASTHSRQVGTSGCRMDESSTAILARVM